MKQLHNNNNNYNNTIDIEIIYKNQINKIQE